MRDPKVLWRVYLSKLNMGLRSTVLSKVWQLDGEDRLPRKPETWEEVAFAVELELSSRADAKAPNEGKGDSLRALVPTEGGAPEGSSLCKHCQRTGHFQEICPLKAAEIRGEVNRAIAEHSSRGTKCTVCGYKDHYANRHR